MAWKDRALSDLVEVDSSDDEDSDDEDDNNCLGNPITGVPTIVTSTTRNTPPVVPSNRPSPNTPSRNMPLALIINRPSANTPTRNATPTVASDRPPANTPARNVPPQAPPTSTTRSEPRESKIPVSTAIPKKTYADAVLLEDVNKVEEGSEEEEIMPLAVLLLEQPKIRLASA